MDAQWLSSAGWEVLDEVQSSCSQDEETLAVLLSLPFLWYLNSCIYSKKYMGRNIRKEIKLFLSVNTDFVCRKF